VLSRRAYHRKTAYAIVCPITSRMKGYPFEVVLPEGLPITGAVLSDQVKSVDRDARRIEVAGRAPAEVTAAVWERVVALIGET